MREILFRGKRIDNGEWETGSLGIIRAGCSDQSVFIADKMTGFHTSVDPGTVGQCTGLKDRNDDLIFEGDIYEYQDFSEEDDPIVRTEITHDELTMYTLSGEIITGFVVYDYCNGEIIGNIHDNPELLEESQ